MSQIRANGNSLDGTSWLASMVKLDGRACFFCCMSLPNSLMFYSQVTWHTAVLFVAHLTHSCPIMWHDNTTSNEALAHLRPWSPGSNVCRMDLEQLRMGQWRTWGECEWWAVYLFWKLNQQNVVASHTFVKRLQLQFRWWMRIRFWWKKHLCMCFHMTVVVWDRQLTGEGHQLTSKTIEGLVSHFCRGHDVVSQCFHTPCQCRLWNDQQQGLFQMIPETYGTDVAAVWSCQSAVCPLVGES